MSNGGQLDASGVRALFRDLSDRLSAVQLPAQLFVVGGAAMALAYDRGRLTRDVDALFVPAAEVRRITEEMSNTHGSNRIGSMTLSKGSCRVLTNGRSPCSSPNGCWYR